MLLLINLSTWQRISRPPVTFAGMSLFIASLNSGSNGNCYYVGNDHEAVLIDAGLSCRETERRMATLGLNLRKVKAIFISHEHTDHIKGLSVLSSRYALPVFITKATLQNSSVRVPGHRVVAFRDGISIQIGGLHVVPFRKYHDAADPHSFTVSGNGITVGVFTDLGRCCDNLKQYFSQCHAAFLEANYDTEMLENGRYPYFLKQRIRGGHGHLSNAEALQLVLEHKAPFLKHVLLSHLSKDNNCPQLAQQLFAAQCEGVSVTVASRFGPSEVICVSQQEAPAPVQQAALGF